MASDTKVTLIRYHFGTDLLMACWLLFLSAILYVWFMCYLVWMSNYVDDDFDSTDYSLLLGSSVVYLVAAWYFLYTSYPEQLQQLEQENAHLDISKLSCLNHYFFGNYYLIASWLIVIATLPVFIYPIWAFNQNLMSATYFSLYMIAILVIFFGLGIWVVATMPVSLAQNGGKGSTYFFDYIVPYLFCCCDKEILRPHLAPDFLVGSWTFAIAGIVSIPSGIYYIYLAPTEWVSYIFFFCCLTFGIGSLIFVYAAYPSQHLSCDVYKWLFCDPDYDATSVGGSNAERTTLLNDSARNQPVNNAQQESDKAV